MQSADPSVERAFVATSYLLGARGDELGASELGPEARRLASALAHPEKSTRVAALAREVARIAVALEQGAIG